MAPVWPTQQAPQPGEKRLGYRGATPTTKTLQLQLVPSRGFNAVLGLTRGILKKAEADGRVGPSLGKVGILVLPPGKATWPVCLLGIQAQLTQPVYSGAGAGHP